ncbi:MAG TPA: hypothetical protein VFV19_16660 [Candidatus Polarisedimenticolaceae bacterium]|nr:hypothetical protein [Candidatus Polarisedimenticolaceae bacterium]
MSRKLRIVLPLLSFFAVTVSVIPAHAQDMPPGQGPGGHGGPGMMGGRGGESMLDQMKKRLNLTPEQEAQIKPILQENAKKLQEMREKHMAANPGQPAPPDPETRKQMMAMREETDAKIAKILTPAQMEEWNKMRAEARQRMMGGPGGDAPPPPPSRN